MQGVGWIPESNRRLFDLCAGFGEVALRKFVVSHPGLATVGSIRVNVVWSRHIDLGGAK